MTARAIAGDTAAVLAVTVAAAAATAGDARADRLDATVRLGVAHAPFDAPALPDADGHGAVILVDGARAIGPLHSAGVRLPVVLVSLAQPAGAYTDRAVLGNPQLRAARRMLARHGLVVWAGLELGLPLAPHAGDLRPDRALAIANGLEGGAAPERFTPGVLPATPYGELSLDARPWRLDVSARLPLLVRISDDERPGMTPMNPVGLAAVLAVQARRRLTRRLTAGLATQLAAALAPVHEPARDRGRRVRDLERASLAIGLGRRRRTELTLALQAALDGSTAGGGIGVSSVW